MKLTDRKVTGHEHLYIRIKAAKVGSGNVRVDGTWSDAACSVEQGSLAGTSSSVHSSYHCSDYVQQTVKGSPLETERGRRVLDDLRQKMAQRKNDATAALDQTAMDKLLEDLWAIDDKLCW